MRSLTVDLPPGFFPLHVPVSHCMCTHWYTSKLTKVDWELWSRQRKDCYKSLHKLQFWQKIASAISTQVATQLRPRMQQELQHCTQRGKKTVTTKSRNFDLMIHFSNSIPIYWDMKEILSWEVVKFRRVATGTACHWHCCQVSPKFPGQFEKTFLQNTEKLCIVIYCKYVSRV